MSLRNATANWSGYNHQGKVGLLVALRKIEALRCTGLNQYRLELETQEDVKLLQGTTVIEVHQVKAYLNSSTIGAYTSALMDFESCAGDNCLHTICEITNWGSLTAAQNPANVILYPYNTTENYCQLDEIDGYIKASIKAILRLQGHAQQDNDGWCHTAFYEYLALLDERIREEHQNGTKPTYNVGFSLEEINHLLISPPVHRYTIVSKIRSSIYEEYIEFIKQQEDGGFAAMSAEHEAFVNKIIKQIALLNDTQIEEFLNQIFPATTQGKTIAASSLTDPFFVAKDFSSTFLCTLIRIENIQLVLEADGYPHYKAGLNYLLTALQHIEVDKRKITRLILANERLNTARYETDFIINEHLSGKLSENAPKVIRRDSGFMAEKDLEFITCVDAVNTLNV